MSFAPPPKIRWAIFIAIALLALVIRLPQLGERPMHTDEAVNAFTTGNLLAGEAFKYDPQDRHGPALFLVAKPIAQLCGAKNFSDLTETQLRLTPVIVGGVMILLFGLAANAFGFIPCLVAALLFAVAPLPVYYNRYFIHETLFLAATFGLILAGWQMLKRNSLGFAALTGLCAALMLACKETAVIHFFALACAGFAVGLASSRKNFPAPKIILTSIATFIIATVLLFTWFGQNWSALTDLFHAVSRFTARAGGEGHAKPFTYYFQLLDPLFVLWLVVTAGIYGVLCDLASGMNRTRLALLIYGVTILLLYSAIPYKQPWLALNLWLPLALVCGFGVEIFWGMAKTSAGRWGIAIAGIFLLSTLGSETQKLAFQIPSDEKNPLAYAHTTSDILGLPAKLEEICRERNLTQPRIAVVMKDTWPLPWYLRKFSKVGYWQPEGEIGDANFFITGSDTPTHLTERLKDFRPEFFGVRPNVLVVLWVPPTKPVAP